tara:strand:- start:30321 stop:31232 length:912 start_codon:yes stop_codon:yes gene_type:complete
MSDDTYIHQSSEVLSKEIGEGTKIWQNVIILDKAKIGKFCNINCFVFIENDVCIGNNVTIKSGVQLWDGLEIGNNVFIGPNTTFTNDKYPISKRNRKKNLKTTIKDNVSIGANATILPGIIINKNSLIGAGSVVTKDIPENAIVAGNPAKIINYKNENIYKNKNQDKLCISSLEPRTINLPTFEDIRGSLSVVEIMNQCPFEIKRVFWTYDVPSKETRGEHSHKKCSQFLVCLKGSLSVDTFQGVLKKNFKLDSPKVGLFIPPQIWSLQYEYTSDAVLLVLASELYDEKDYIRSYQQYLDSLK